MLETSVWRRDIQHPEWPLKIGVCVAGKWGRVGTAQLTRVRKLPSMPNEALNLQKIPWKPPPVNS